APVARPLGEVAVPVAQPLRGQLDDRELAQLWEDVAVDDAFDALDRFAAAAAVVLQVVGHGARDGIGPVWAGALAGGAPLVPNAPFAGSLLGLGEVENAVAVGVLQIVGERQLGLAVDTLIVAPARDPSAAGCAPAIAEMETLFDHAPVWLRRDREAQSRAAGCEGSFTNGARHDESGKFLPTFCLLSVDERPRTTKCKLNGSARKI